MAPRFIGLFPIYRIISPTVVRLNLPCSLTVHPTFHVSQIKPVSPLMPAEPPPPLNIDGGPAYLVCHLLAHAARVGACSTWLIGRDTASKKDHGFPLDTSWTVDSSPVSTNSTWTSPLWLQQPQEERRTRLIYPCGRGVILKWDRTL